MRGTPRSNPRKSALESLRYLPRFVTFRAKPYLDCSLTKDHSRVPEDVCYADAMRSHRDVAICAPYEYPFVTTKNCSDRSCGSPMMAISEKCLNSGANRTSVQIGQVNYCVLYIHSIHSHRLCALSFGEPCLALSCRQVNSGSNRRRTRNRQSTIRLWTTVLLTLLGDYGGACSR